LDNYHLGVLVEPEFKALTMIAQQEENGLDFRWRIEDLEAGFPIPNKVLGKFREIQTHVSHSHYPQKIQKTREDAIQTSLRSLRKIVQNYQKESFDVQKRPTIPGSVVTL
jgi:hypothetical protein